MNVAHINKGGTFSEAREFCMINPKVTKQSRADIMRAA